MSLAAYAEQHGVKYFLISFVDLFGVMRSKLLSQGTLHERVLTRSDLAHAQGLALINSVRGWIDVNLTST